MACITEIWPEISSFFFFLNENSPFWTRALSWSKNVVWKYIIFAIFPTTDETYSSIINDWNSMVLWFRSHKKNDLLGTPSTASGTTFTVNTSRVDASASISSISLYLSSLVSWPSTPWKSLNAKTNNQQQHRSLVTRCFLLFVAFWTVDFSLRIHGF